MESKWSDDRLEALLGSLLRAGVILAAIVVLAGAIPNLIKFGCTPPHYRVFKGEPAELRSVAGIVGKAIHFDSRGIIQFGLLLLIATPIARVAASLAAFVLQRDRLYVFVTFIVLSTLLYSLLGAH